ncbi:MAG: hypothetical protein U0R19_17050 [Bryobacteraceae bacterium]
MNLPLVIRAEQMEAFRRQLTTGLAARLLAGIERLYPGQACAALSPHIEAAIAAARACGIVSEEHLLHYLEFVLHYGPGFPDAQSTPWACEILRQTDLTAEEKLRRLDGYELFEMGRTSA